MKFRFIYSCASLLFLAVLLSSNNNGRANEQGWGNTGAPGDQTLVGGQPRTCISCHGSSSAIEVDLEIDIKDATGNSIASSGYIPGETYEVSVSINTVLGSPSAFAFQMLALNAPEGEPGNEVSQWTPVTNNVQVSFASNTNRTYVEQTAPSQGSNEFRMNWVAPQDLDGEVTFYSCGNGVNLNGSTSGDNAACNTLTISKSTTSSSRDLAQAALRLEVFPNPVNKLLNLDIYTENSGVYSIRLFNSVGQAVYTKALNLSSGDHREQINMNLLNQGVYVLQIQNDRQITTRNVVKL